MKNHYNIIIAGAGGIGEAAGLLLAEWSETTPSIFIGDLYLDKAQKVAAWIKEGATRPCNVTGFQIPAAGMTEDLIEILQKSDVLLDCLPGSQAPKMAKMARDFHLHYANLTEYVAETNEIITLAQGATTGFVLQTGLAPGYIDVLANRLFRDFCSDHQVDKVDKLEFKVGALTDNAVAPHFYGFTWSPVGVATEYMKDAVALRDYKKTTLPSLSETTTLIIDGVTYEDDLTSGGTADLPDALAGKVRTLDYKTIRYPGHYNWVRAQRAGLGNDPTSIAALQKKMEDQIPHIENDRIVLYAAVEGKDASGTLHRREVARQIFPMTVGKRRLRAIQVTTAAPLLQSAQFLLETASSGIVLQSQIDPGQFLSGNFVERVYGKV